MIDINRGNRITYESFEMRCWWSDCQDCQ